MAHIRLDVNATAPATPPANTSIIYPKSDGKWYRKDSTGTETELGAGVGGSKFSLYLSPASGEPPATLFATQDTRNNHPVLDFDQTLEESIYFTRKLVGYMGGILRVNIYWMATTATSGNVVWEVSWEKMNLQTLGSDSFGSPKSVTKATGASSDIYNVTSIDFTSTEIDGTLAGELFRLRIRRIATGNTMTGDAELLGASIEEQ